MSGDGMSGDGDFDPFKATPPLAGSIAAYGYNAGYCECGRIVIILNCQRRAERFKSRLNEDGDVFVASENRAVQCTACGAYVSMPTTELKATDRTQRTNQA
jgi:hypothetical protein